MQVTDATFETVEGDARNVLCEAVERHKASLLVLGSHGYTAFKRYNFSINVTLFTLDRILIMCYSLEN